MCMNVCIYVQTVQTNEMTHDAHVVPLLICMYMHECVYVKYEFTDVSRCQVVLFHAAHMNACMHVHA